MKSKKKRGLLKIHLIVWCIMIAGCSEPKKETDDIKQNNVPEQEKIVTVTESPANESLQITKTPDINIGQDEGEEDKINDTVEDAENKKRPISCRIENGALIFSGDGRLTSEIVDNLITEKEEGIEALERDMKKKRSICHSF